MAVRSKTLLFCNVIGGEIFFNNLKADGISDIAPHQRNSLNVWNDVGGLGLSILSWQAPQAQDGGR